MINIITIDREYGAGGSDIARKLADRLGWKFFHRLFQAVVGIILNSVGVLEGTVERSNAR